MVLLKTLIKQLVFVEYFSSLVQGSGGAVQGSVKLPKPNLKVEPNIEDFFTGESLTLTCLADGLKGDLKYKFMKDGVAAGCNITNNTCKYMSVSPTDIGKHTCQIAAESEPSIEKSIQIKVKLNKPELKVTPQSDIFTSGDSLVLTCSVKKAKTGVTYRFMKNGRDAGCKVTGNNCTYESVKEGDRGNYTCEISTESEPSLQRSIDVKDTPSKPKLSLDPDSDEYHIGDAVTLTCSTTDPSATVIFMKDGKNPGCTVTNNTCIYTSVTADDSGKHTCEISNGTKGSELSNERIIKVNAFYLSLSNETETTLSYGQKLSLLCETDANITSVTWQKDNKPLPDNDGHNIESSGNISNLIISQVNQSNKGNYTCSATDGQFSETSDTIDITVHDWYIPADVTSYYAVYDPMSIKWRLTGLGVATLIFLILSFFCFFCCNDSAKEKERQKIYSEFVNYRRRLMMMHETEHWEIDSDEEVERHNEAIYLARKSMLLQIIKHDPATSVLNKNIISREAPTTKLNENITSNLS